ncbi:FtsK/SpoIIIE domain-containing protein [Nocardioides sp.]|uniref:FtsK/SpoIIIE domain-containing protein n=1 Tax=Nocardioides sp. TaxID=35761 RepID=UPI002C17E2E1|nr:FtsK/SpoIIIE domain-containing protein [Nocardioides sp.]HSX67126.1 FtsK/SpoIIIE domain-containing protein [Nocardioides sp.]
MTSRLLDVRWLARWARNHRRWLAGWLIVASLAMLLGSTATAAQTTAVAVAPGLLGLIWRAAAPVAFERWCAGPARRLGWRRHVRGQWVGIAEWCHMTERVAHSVRRDGRKVSEYRTVAPKLRKVRTRGHLLELTVRARAGQTIEDLEEAVPRLASTLAAVSYRTRPISGGTSGCTTVIELVMADALTTAATAVEPAPYAACDAVRVGRTQSGADWMLQVRGRHTLIAGCSGSGKGSILWGIVGGLAPAVRTDLVRLWGVDLKRGVELEMGSGLLSAKAYTPADALRVLKALMAVIDERGAVMAGTTRLHEPAVGDPLHVLVIDELAALTAYADVSIRREAERLLSEILTQGRALGVVVVACVQDPRKDVVTMRGLFTQTVALRLRSTEETSMVLGDGMTKTAPAHRISPTFPGTAWVVEDTGAADRVRADYWPDELIRDLASRYATEVQVELPAEEERESFRTRSTEPDDRPRKPRSPRKPRTTADPAVELVEDGAA